ncbi:MAG: hypothetical protein HY646_18815, partial [Acidobacteria bacterium]|nr:hypothetical protein [Acidobacteriota bacterium]
VTRFPQPYFVISRDEPAIGIVQTSSTVRRTSHLVNIRDDEDLFRPSETTTAGFSIRAASQKFYQNFSDAYDFLAFFSSVSARFSFFHQSAKNDVQGIGSGIFNSTSVYGSAGKLQGVNYIGPILDVLPHEMMHQWGVFLDPSLELDEGTAHWGAVNIPGRLFGLGFNSNGNGTFTITRGVSPFVPAPTPYPPMEQYLMGLIPPEDVPPVTVLRGIDPFSVSIGNVVTPTSTRTVTIQDVINIEGPRIPSSQNSPKAFRLAGILLTSKRLATDAEMIVYDRFMQQFASTSESLVDISGNTVLPFRALTGGRATIDTTIVVPSSLTGIIQTLVPDIGTTGEAGVTVIDDRALDALVNQPRRD